jgi:cob(I)alamin adenosyltransferase
MLPYEELVEMIAHIKAAQAVVGLEETEGDLHEIMAELHRAQNTLNRMRLAQLGNGQNRPFHVAEITQI